MSLLMEAFNITKVSATWADVTRVNSLKANEDENQTIILVRNSTSSPTNYGSNKFNSYSGSVQIQVFLSLNAPFDLEQKLVELMREFNDRGWQISESRPAIPDPDTRQLTATIIVSKTKEAH